MEFIDGLKETLQNPNMRHAAMVHFPIALSMIGLLVTLLSACLMGRNAALRWLAIVTFIALTASAWLTANSGDAADHQLKPDLVAAAHDLLEEHEELGEKVWLFAAGTLVLTVLSLVKKPAVRATGAWLAVLGAAVTAGWVGATAQHGGEAVYKHGAGTAAYESERPETPPGGVSPGAGAGAASVGVAADDPKVAFYLQTVRPIIDRNCLRCHDQRRHKGGLVQTSVAGLLKGGESGPAIVPGKPQDSLMFRKITDPDDDERMPPKRQLAPEQIAAIEQWIRDGAVGE